MLWQTKLHARLHDPAEKALVLLRDPAGHERGTSRVLWRMARAEEIPADDVMDNDNAEVLHAVAFSNGIKSATYKTVQRADWWAAAADRPQWPMQEISVKTDTGEEKTLAVADFAQVHWAKQPQLIHPLSGATYDLARHGGLTETDITDLKQRSFAHFSRLLRRADGVTDFKQSLLAFWRFGPEVDSSEENDFGKLGALWNLLPADTRVPDHSIWDHLDLTSAFAGAFAADENGEAALLSLSIGPVQSFIEAARSTSDLWAGSHLLARLAWEAMKPVCDQLGPDAILFPRLRGVPQVDVWLRDECGLPGEWFSGCEWTRKGTDANPLFSAALPNRFVAVVPASQAAQIAGQVETTVRGWLQDLGKRVVDELLEKAGMRGEHCYRQMQEQLEGFPEVHWAAVPFSLIRCRDGAKQRDLDVTPLSAAMRPFFDGEGEPGFLGSPAWLVLRKETVWEDNTTFFAPNPGVLYPAVHDLAERVLAAAKTTRRFMQTRQEGWRCTLTGETEWLSTDPEQRNWNQTYRKLQGTLWTTLEGRFGIKKGEHLGALPAVKRLWPTLFAREAAVATGDEVSRFVVSTHAMALAGPLAEWIEKGEMIPRELSAELERHERVALPRKLVLKAYEHHYEQGRTLARIPAWLDAARESEDERALEAVNRKIEDLLGKKPETYYALLMMDGDRMGAWLSGENAIAYRDSFHQKVRDGIQPFAAKHPALEAYFSQTRALSPNRHLAISAALNDFSLSVARHVVEEEFMGRLIYAGGDDVLAMLPVSDLLPCMQRLRAAYSGHDGQQNAESRGRDRLVLRDGFALLGNKLMRMMGSPWTTPDGRVHPGATASIGAVIAHHQAPLSAVLRALRAAEKRAKNEGDRDAFSLTVLKRSGGALFFTDKWQRDGVDPVLTCLRELALAFRDEDASRRAAYHVQAWSTDLPEPSQLGSADAYREMIRSLLHYQFERQGLEAKGQPMHSARLGRLMPVDSRNAAMDYINNLLAVAEFLARETRGGTNTVERTAGVAA
ncbi:MAG: type III-B CRISPR-associated protein Cas10/Cmr2 [Pseudomonadota bacterium]